MMVERETGDPDVIAAAGMAAGIMDHLHQCHREMTIDHRDGRISDIAGDRLCLRRSNGI